MQKQLRLPLSQATAKGKTGPEKCINLQRVVCLESFSKQKKNVMKKEKENKIFREAAESAEKIFG